MKSTFAAVFLAFSMVLMPAAALAGSVPSSSDSRYFVQTASVFWRNAFDARDIFADGFTADLSDLEVSVAKFAGLHPIAVKRFTILDDEVAVSSPTPDVTPTPTPAPARPMAWGVRFMVGNAPTPAAGKGIKVAVLDTGIDREHPDLQRRIAKCTDYTDPLVPFIDQECADDNGHGTHVAGIIAADGGPDGLGIEGIAPEADLLIYKVCNGEGLCLSDDIAKGIEGAVNDGANMIVLGFGGEADSSFVDDALAFAADHGVLVIAAAGNNGPYEDSMDWPARNPLTVAVGALAGDGTVPEFSSRGSAVQFAAPGENIESTFKDGGYAILSGTSMAAPHVAGLAARVWQSKAEHPAEATRLTLHEMAKDIGPAGSDSASGWGVPTF
jgi:subtilisin